MAGGGQKATITALVANAGIAVAKFAAFAFTGSAAMLAEGIHSVADTSNQALLLLGMKRAKRRPTAEHPFGYGRERYFWAFVVAMILFSLGSLFSLFEGFEKLRHPHAIESLSWAVGVLVVAMVFETYAFRTAIREANHVRTGSWWSFIRRSKSPELPVVLLEDAGALIGLTFALGGVGLAALTGNPRFDAIGTLAIGVLLGVIAVILAVEMKSLLIGESASLNQLRSIEEAMRADPDLEEVLHVRTQHLGPDELLVGAKVKLRADLSFEKVVEVINRIETAVREQVPEARAMYIEPDLVGSPTFAADAT